MKSTDRNGKSGDGMGARTKATLILAATAGFLLNAKVSEAALFTNLSDPNGAGGTIASGINNAGQIVGSYVSAGNVTNGFVYMVSNGTYSTLNMPGATATAVTGLSSNGAFAGHWTDVGGGNHGFTDVGGVISNFIDYPGVTGNSYGAGINAADTVAGYYFNGTTHGFIESGGSYTAIDEPNAVNVTEALGINDAGSVVGFYRDSGGVQRGFIRTPGGTFTTVNDPLGALGTVVTGINATGDLAGYYVDASGTVHGFLKTGATFRTVDDPLAQGLTEVLGLNNTDQLVGVYIAANGAQVGFSADLYVPEPATIAILGLALVGMSPLRRWRSRSG